VGRLLPRLVRHRALGAELPRRSRRSRDGQRPSEDIEADPGTGVPATSGVKPYSAAALDGGRWSGTNRHPEPVNEAGQRTNSDLAERRTASAPANTKST